MTARRPEDLRFLSGVIPAEPERLVTFYRDLLGVALAEERHGDCSTSWTRSVSLPSSISTADGAPSWTRTSPASTTRAPAGS